LQIEYIAGWLAETAQRARYQRDVNLIPSAQQAAATRLKGKARKEARNAAAGSNASAATYRINVGEFVPMAETIANRTP